MEENENSIDPNQVRSSIEDAAWNADSDPAVDPDSPPDAWWLRWLKFLAIIAVPALILGLALMFTDMAHQYQSTHFTQNQLAQSGTDWLRAEKFKFLEGAAVGGGLGMIYVVRCIMRKVDP